MKIALLATRNLIGSTHYELINATLLDLTHAEYTENGQFVRWVGGLEIHHGAEGAGKLHAETWAREHQAEAIGHAPDWKTHGRAAGPIRGKELVRAADVVVALWDGKSQGTKNELAEARKQGKRIKLLLV